MLTACDVSYYQAPVDDRYPHRWLIFRCCDGPFLDPNAGLNAQWSSRAVASGRMDGWTAYVVYRPGQNAAVLANVAKLPPGGHAMVDVESWGGAISGDHSDEINALVAELRKTHPGRVWAYGNQGDLASIYPRRGDVPIVVASYGGSKPNVANLIGWQYTDGTYHVEGLPSSSPPFGACDHNVLYVGEATASTNVHSLGGLVSDLSPEKQERVYQAADAFLKRLASFDKLLYAFTNGKGYMQVFARGATAVLGRIAAKIGA